MSNLFRLRNKKSQEEIVGFVIIVLVVMVAFVIFLGISIRQKSQPISFESREIYQFLDSLMEYTTECALSYEPDFSTVSELLYECSSNSKICISGESSCNVLNKTIQETIDSAFEVSKEANINGYEFESIYQLNNSIQPKSIIKITNGDCSNQAKGSEIISPAYPGTIITTFKLCS